MKIREILIDTISEGIGDMYEYPLRLDYYNPIEVIYSYGGGSYHMRFGTRDGDYGQQYFCPFSLPYVSTLKADTEYSRIEVWYGNCLHGIRFYNKENVCVLQAGQFSGSVQ